MKHLLNMRFSSSLTRVLRGRSRYRTARFWGVIGLTSCLTLLTACSADDGGSGGDDGTGTDGPPGSDDTTYTCDDRAPACMIEQMVDGNLLRSCQDFLYPTSSYFTEATCAELEGPGETTTFFPDGCPEDSDWLGRCLKEYTSTNGTLGMWFAASYYKIDSPNSEMLHQLLRDDCRGATTDNGTLEVTWCPGLLP